MVLWWAVNPSNLRLDAFSTSCRFLFAAPSTGFAKSSSPLSNQKIPKKNYKLLRSAHFWTLQIFSKSIYHLIIIFYIPLSYVIIYLKHLSVFCWHLGFIPFLSPTKVKSIWSLLDFERAKVKKPRNGSSQLSSRVNQRVSDKFFLDQLKHYWRSTSICLKFLPGEVQRIVQPNLANTTAYYIETLSMFFFFFFLFFRGWKSFIFTQSLELSKIEASNIGA